MPEFDINVVSEYKVEANTRELAFSVAASIAASNASTGIRGHSGGNGHATMTNSRVQDPALHVPLMTTVERVARALWWMTTGGDETAWTRDIESYRRMARNVIDEPDYKPRRPLWMGTTA